MAASAGDPSQARPRTTRNPAYWIVAVSLVVLGFLSIFSIGAPLLALGLALVALAPARARPQTFWPPLVGVVSFFGGYVLVAPLGCTTSAVSSTTHGAAAAEAAHTVCTNAIGLDYSGGAGYNPSLLPAVVAGAALAVVAWAVSRWLIGRTVARRGPGSGASGSVSVGPRPRAAWWILAGGFLGFSLIGWLEGILSFLVAMAVIARLGARRTPGWPLLLTGAGMAMAPLTVLLWVHPACHRATAFGRPGRPVVERCLGHVPPVVWPFALSLGLIAVGLILFLWHRKGAARQVA